MWNLSGKFAGQPDGEVGPAPPGTYGEGESLSSLYVKIVLYGLLKGQAKGSFYL